MKISNNEEQYELMMIDYQITEVSRLNEVLKRCGVKDIKLRKKICGEFADYNGSFLDQGSFKGEADLAFPELLFSKRRVDPNEGIGEIEELIVPDYASNFHEYSFGAIEYYFDEKNEGLGEIETKMP